MCKKSIFFDYLNLRGELYVYLKLSTLNRVIHALKIVITLKKAVKNDFHIPM